MTRYRTRALRAPLVEALANMPVVVMTGMRQTGKSTLLQQDAALAGRAYVSLDDFAQLEAARRDPEAFLGREGPLTVDEAQRCPELLLEIKRTVDRDRRPGRFLLSGSANFTLLRGVADSLAGRAVYLTLHPFTQREIHGDLGRPPLIKRAFADGRPPGNSRANRLDWDEVLRGGLPPVVLGLVRNPRVWFTGFEQTYLERDIRDLSRLGDLVSFRSLLKLAALRTAQVLKISELARDAKIAAATAGRYLSLLEASFVISRIPPFLVNEASRLIKSPKLFVSDAGLAAHLVGFPAGEAVASDPLLGALLETYVAQNLLGILAAEWPGARLAYWHVQGRHEVDFVVEAGRDCLAIEVKAAPRWTERDLSGLRIFLERTPGCRIALLAHAGTATVSLGERLWAIPIHSLLN
ncbi:MAG TPA: ATP-binding protein [Candidatus Methylomirabilis sp.]|nr:ATP-binding protein [Candidatus Methylomirabilis sp.]